MQNKSRGKIPMENGMHPEENLDKTDPPASPHATADVHAIVQSGLAA